MCETCGKKASDAGLLMFEEVACGYCCRIWRDLRTLLVGYIAICSLNGIPH